MSLCSCVFVFARMWLHACLSFFQCTVPVCLNTRKFRTNLHLFLLVCIIFLYIYYLCSVIYVSHYFFLSRNFLCLTEFNLHRDPMFTNLKVNMMTSGAGNVYQRCVCGAACNTSARAIRVHARVVYLFVLLGTEWRRWDRVPFIFKALGRRVPVQQGKILSSLCLFDQRFGATLKSRLR